MEEHDPVALWQHKGGSELAGLAGYDQLSKYEAMNALQMRTRRGGLTKALRICVFFLDSLIRLSAQPVKLGSPHKFVWPLPFEPALHLILQFLFLHLASVFQGSGEQYGDKRPSGTGVIAIARYQRSP